MRNGNETKSLNLSPVSYLNNHFVEFTIEVTLKHSSFS